MSVWVLLLACSRHAPVEDGLAAWCAVDGPVPQDAVPRGLPRPQSTRPTAELLVAGHPIVAELADEPSERQTGLMARTTLEPDAGMLFVYPDARERGFWMKNTLLPLSIAYLDDEGAIVHIADMRPLCEELVPSHLPARYALEANRGWFGAQGVRIGDRVTRADGAPLPVQAAP